MEKSHPYADILDAARPEPPAQHPRMSAHDRAGQFGPLPPWWGMTRR